MREYDGRGVCRGFPPRCMKQMADLATDEQVREAEGRSGTQRVGLILGPALCAAILVTPTMAGLIEQAAGMLGQPADHADVLEVARGAQNTLGLVVLMVVWWVTEAVPIPVTALLPGLMLPLLHVTGFDEGQLFPFKQRAAFAGYANPVIYLFLAGFLLAAGMRKAGLDRRITLSFLTLRAVRSSCGTILLSVMAITACLSMWISNTATTAMMLPIAVGILHELKQKPGESRMGCALLLGVAWSASIGGIGTIIGSPPNAMVVGILRGQELAEIGFLEWMKVGLPVALFGVLAAWGLLMVLFRPRASGLAEAANALENQRRALGKWTTDEKFTLAVFALVVALWLSQPFWKGSLPQSVYERISWFGVYGIGLFCAMLLFVVPVDWRCWRTVLNWRDSHYVDWGTLLLFGGGISLSHAMFKTGLTNWLAGGVVDQLQSVSPWLCLIVIVLLVDFLTEITSNTAVTTMMTPILVVLAPGLGLDRVTLCVAAAMAASLAFMLPVATPPNALVYSTGYFRISQMMRAGVLMNLLGCLVLVGCLYAFGGGILEALPTAPATSMGP